MMKTFAAAAAATLLVAGSALAQQKPATPAAPAKPAAAEDRYVGYYYPKPNSTEIYESSMQAIDGVAVVDQDEIELKAIEDAEIVLVETDKLN